MARVSGVGLVLLALCAVATAAEVTWDTVVRLTTNTSSQVLGYSGQHSVAVDGKGNVHLAWLDQRTVPYQIWHRRYDAGARTWLAETMLTNRPANCFRPGLACDSAGNVHLSWHVENWQGPGIWYKRRDAATRRWSPDALIDTGTTSRLQQYPSVACAWSSKQAALAWCGLPDSGLYYRVFLRERLAAGDWDTTLQVSTAATNHDQVSVAASTDGDLAVAWCGRDFGHSHNQVFCRRRVDGAWQEIEQVSVMTGELTQYSPCVAFDRRRALHVVWHGRSQMNIYQQVFHRQRDTNGWAGIDSVSRVRPYEQRFPAVACDAAGRCHVVWCSKGGTEHTQLAYAQRDTNGVWSSPLILTGLDSGNVNYPSIACQGAHTIHLIWYDDHTGNQDIYYLRGAMPGAGMTESSPWARATSSSPQATIMHGTSTLSASRLMVGAHLYDARGNKVRSVGSPGSAVNPLPTGLYFVRSPSGSSQPLAIVIVR